MVYKDYLYRINRVAAINPEFSSCFFLNDTAQLNTRQFYQIKNRLAAHLFNKTVISIDDILNPGPEPLAGLRHGVPGEGTHHLPDLRDLGHGLVVKLHKIVRRAAGRGAGRPDPLLTHLHEVLLEQVLHPLAVVVRGACAVHCVHDCFLAVTYLVLINLPL